MAEPLEGTWGLRLCLGESIDLACSIRIGFRSSLVDYCVGRSTLLGLDIHGDAVSLDNRLIKHIIIFVVLIFIS